MRARNSMCAGSQMPRSCGVMRPRASTADASMQTSPAPPTARLPRCTRCQSVANPSSEEYWHMGETAIRLRKAISRMASGAIKFATGGELIVSVWQRRARLVRNPPSSPDYSDMTFYRRIRTWLTLAILCIGTVWGTGPSYSAAGIVNASDRNPAALPGLLRYDLLPADPNLADTGDPLYRDGLGDRAVLLRGRHCQRFQLRCRAIRAEFRHRRLRSGTGAQRTQVGGCRPGCLYLLNLGRALPSHGTELRPGLRAGPAGTAAVRWSLAGQFPHV